MEGATRPIKLWGDHQSVHGFVRYRTFERNGDGHPVETDSVTERVTICPYAHLKHIRRHRLHLFKEAWQHMMNVWTRLVSSWDDEDRQPSEFMFTDVLSLRRRTSAFGMETSLRSRRRFGKLIPGMSSDSRDGGRIGDE
jgi:hypothetical protein